MKTVHTHKITSQQFQQIAQMVYSQTIDQTVMNGRLYVEDNFVKGKCTHSSFVLLDVYEYLIEIKVVGGKNSESEKQLNKIIDMLTPYASMACDPTLNSIITKIKNLR
jgi:hypothetical protein